MVLSLTILAAIMTAITAPGLIAQHLEAKRRQTRPVKVRRD